MKAKNKKGQIQGATGIAIGLITLVLILAVGAIVVNDFQESQGDKNCPTAFSFNTSNDMCFNASNTSQTNVAPNSGAFNITDDGLNALDNMSTQVPTVGTIAIASILIALVVAGFVVARR